VEFYAARRGPFIATLVAVLFGVLIGVARILLREGLRQHNVIGLFSVPCLIAALGLFYLKPWARILTLTLLLALAAWIGIDLYRVETLSAFPIWYRAMPMIGNDAVALQVVGGIDLMLYVLLTRARYGFYPPDNFVPRCDAL
jgi:hypothetical protein